MKKPVLLLLASSLASMSFGQAAQIVFNVTAGGQPYMVWNPSPIVAAGAYQNLGAYLVIDNPSNTALWYQPANSATIPANTGIMRTEAVQNKIRWAMGNTVATYYIPYANQSNVPMPFTLQKVGAIGAGSFVFSTYDYYPYLSTQPWGGPVTPGNNEWDNTQYMAAAGVTHMNDYTTGLPNNSNNAVNRYWIVNPSEANAGLWPNYVTAPLCTLTFVHPNTDIDVVPPADAIVPGVGGTPLSAQRFNNTANQWGDFLPPTINWTGGATTGSVTTSIIGANFFPAWTLSTTANPLPIELTNWNGSCDSKKVKLMWTTATEHNNAYFTIEKSRDNVAWLEIGQVQSVGNSVTSTIYSFEDEDSQGMAYYKLIQTDVDGAVRELGVVVAGCDANSTEIVNTWDDGTDLNIVVSSTNEANYDLVLSDAQGKVMVSRPAQAINKGYTPLKVNKAGIATGIYVVSLQNARDVMTRRVMVY